MLFLIYINDVFLGCGVKSVLYADDATLVNPAKLVNKTCNRANATLQLIHKRLTENKLTVNCSKTKLMLVSPKPYRVSNKGELFPIKLNKNVTSEVNEFKFLGLQFTHNLKWSAHISILLEINCVFAWKSSERSSQRSFFIIYIPFPCFSHMSYCISTWCSSNATLVSCLQSLCNKIMQAIFYRNNRACWRFVYNRKNSKNH